MLEMKNVTFSYKNKKHKKSVNVLKDVSLQFEKGKMYALFGPSGAGKTTCLSIMGGLDSPDQGVVQIDGKELSEYGLQNVRNSMLAYVFQDYQLFPYMTAIENVMVAIRIRGVLKEKNKQKKASIDVLEQVGIDRSQMNRPVSKLSGGQQQRVAIARALVNDVDYILADEPTGNLDEENAKKIMELLMTLAHEYGKCVVVVTHSTMIRENCDVKIRLGGS